MHAAATFQQQPPPTHLDHPLCNISTARSAMDMEGDALFKWALCWGFAVAPCLWWICTSSAVPYGRHHSPNTPSWPFAHVVLPTRIAWFLMEVIPLAFTPLFFAQGRFASQSVPCTLVVIFLSHYVHRALIYPLRMQPSSVRNFPVTVLVSGVFFNIYNAFIQGRSLSQFTVYPRTWLTSSKFLLGFTLFMTGMTINIWADSNLMSLRKSIPKAAAMPTDPRAKVPTMYSIPKGGLFELVTCPNYFGEMLEWLGWAIATWSSAGLVFFLSTVCNLMPRGLTHHQWYIRNFPSYPQKRKAVIPFIL